MTLAETNAIDIKINPAAAYTAFVRQVSEIAISVDTALLAISSEQSSVQPAHGSNVAVHRPLSFVPSGEFDTTYTAAERVALGRQWILLMAVADVVESAGYLLSEIRRMSAYWHLASRLDERTQAAFEKWQANDREEERKFESKSFKQKVTYLSDRYEVGHLPHDDVVDSLFGLRNYILHRRSGHFQRTSASVSANKLIRWKRIELQIDEPTGLLWRGTPPSPKFSSAAKLSVVISEESRELPEHGWPILTAHDVDSIHFTLTAWASEKVIAFQRSLERDGITTAA